MRCIITIRNNNKTPEQNEIDLIKAIPLEIRKEECLATVVDPTAISSLDKEEKRDIVTEATHIAGAITSPWIDKIEFYENTIISFIHGEKLAEKIDAKIEGLGTVRKQNYSIPPGFHSPNAFVGYIKKMFKTEFEDRYLIMKILESFSTDTKVFIKEIEIGLERSAVEPGEIIEKNLKLKSDASNNIKPKF